MGVVSRLTLVSVLAVAALAALSAAPAAAQLPCGILRPCPPPPPPPNPGPGAGDEHDLIFTVDPLRIEYDREDPEEVRASGLYLRNGAPAFATVEIVAGPWPDTREVLLSRNGTDFVFPGRFGISAGIGANTRYIARTDTNPDPNVVGWATSDIHKVTIYPKFLGMDVKFVGRRAVRMKFSYDFPPGFSYPLAGRKIHWYILKGKKKRPKIKKVARSKVRMSDENVLSGRVRTRLPKGRYKFRAAFCVDIPLGVDVGVGEPVTEPCP